MAVFVLKRQTEQLAYERQTARVEVWSIRQSCSSGRISFLVIGLRAAGSDLGAFPESIARHTRAIVAPSSIATSRVRRAHRQLR